MIMSESHLFPAKSEVGRSFWKACSERRFSLPRCVSCGRLRWYLLPTCPHCYTVGYDWPDLSGAATLFSYTVVHRSFHLRFDGQIPYVTAFVTPVEDPAVRFVTRIVDCAPTELQIGMPMQVSFTDADGILMPYFKPAL
jgi:uncharacterized OB-fold protein